MSFFSVYQWKSHLPQDSIYFHLQDLSQAIQALRDSLLVRRKGLDDSDTQHDIFEEGALLHDVEACLTSAEIVMNITTKTVYEDIHSPPPPPPPPPEKYPSREVRVADRRKPAAAAAATEFGRSPIPQQEPPDLRPLTINPKVQGSPDIRRSEDSSVKIRQSQDSSAKHQGSSDSDADSIADPEPDFEDGFPSVVYAELIASLQQDVQRELQAGHYQKAEQSHRKAMKYLTDRETSLNIPFDNRTEMHEILAEIYHKQQQLDKAKRVLNRLLMQETEETDRKWRLYHALATIYQEQARLPEAQKFAKRAYIGRDKSLGKGHPLILESVTLLIRIYEQQGEMEPAEALKKVYRLSNSVPQTPVTPVTPPKAHQVPQVIEISRHHDDGLHPVSPSLAAANRNRVRWAPDAWVDPSSINALTKSGETPLIAAISSGDEEMVRLVLQRGADVEARCVEEISPLMHAVNHGYEVIAEELLRKDAQADETTSGWTPLHRATDMVDVRMVKLLLANDADIEARSPKEFLPKRSTLDRMKSGELDDSDDGASSTKEQGWTALLRAASKGDEVMVRLLLDKGADIEARNPSKCTPLMCAAEGKHEAVVDLLLIRGADESAQDEFGWRPLHRALVHRGGEKVAQLLLDHEAHVDATCAYKKTPLHHAIEKNNDSMVCFLLNAGADIEARDIAERTPLHTAIESRLEIMVRLLLESGADADAKDRGGKDALGAANHVLRRSPEIITLLVKHKKARRGSDGKESTRKGSASVSSVSTGATATSWWSRRSTKKQR